VKVHDSKENYVHRLTNRIARLRASAADAGMTTAEYAMGTLAAVAFAGVLFKVVSGSKVQAALTGLIDKALS
jgi:hypothetical protein